MTQKKTTVYYQDEEKLIILEASKLLALPLASFIRSSAIEKAREVLRKNKGVDF